MTRVSSNCTMAMPKLPSSADKPAGRTPGIGSGLGGELVDAARLYPLPQRDELAAEQRNVVEPSGRRRQFERDDRAAPADDAGRSFGDRRDREPERRDENQQQRQGHHHDGECPPVPQPVLHPQHYRPGRDDQVSPPRSSPAKTATISRTRSRSARRQTGSRGSCGRDRDGASRAERSAAPSSPGRGGGPWICVKPCENGISPPHHRPRGIIGVGLPGRLRHRGAPCGHLPVADQRHRHSQ